MPYFDNLDAVVPHRVPLRPSALKTWLSAVGSLTKHLQRHGTTFEVKVLYQGVAPLYACEQKDLAHAYAAMGLVREVILLVDGHPVVFARSVTTLSHAHGPWRALKGLGSRPLAQLLFSEKRTVQRSELKSSKITSHGPLHGRVVRQLRLSRLFAETKLLDLSSTPLWERHSIFKRHGAHLRVMEVFLPSSIVHQRVSDFSAPLQHPYG